MFGKFAAGNLFVGQYLKTLGTNGSLGWGRPFASRPKALKVYVQYTPAAVTDIGKDIPSTVPVPAKGDMDCGIIYVAIVDESKKQTNDVDAGKPKEWPVVIKTADKNKDRKLFSKNDENVIAYGERVFTEATGGMIEVEIPLEYFKTDVKASNIIRTCSASKYGDYFTGGPSVMYVDDFELVY